MYKLNLGGVLLTALGIAAADEGCAHTSLTILETLGKRVFFDDISNPETVSCSSCHVPETGWTTPRNDTAVMPGAVSERFGNRKPPSNAYIVFSPVLDREERTGGAFWDARADGTLIASLALDGVDPGLLGPAADQSLAPFTNPLEHNTTAEGVCEHVERNYGRLYAQAWGKAIDCGANGVEESFARIGLSIAAYEASPEVSPFASRFDAGLLTPQERRGFELFTGEATCSGCHTVEDGAQPGDGSRQLFTNFKAFNIGVPRNPDNPFYAMDSVVDNNGDVINPLGLAFVDTGFIDTNGDPTGQFKTPTLRNVAKVPFDGFVKRYAHNGFFNSLESIVHFYNTRDVKPVCPFGFTVDEALQSDCWPAPENAENLAGEGTDQRNIGNLGLSDEDEAALVAFLSSLSDETVGFSPGRDARTGGRADRTRGGDRTPDGFDRSGTGDGGRGGFDGGRRGHGSRSGGLRFDDRNGSTLRRRRF